MWKQTLSARSVFVSGNFFCVSCLLGPLLIFQDMNPDEVTLDPKSEQKYDRQLRYASTTVEFWLCSLWGAIGQKGFETIELCVIGSGPAATECLKNLALPGLGHFTIIDNKKVTAVDLSNNFFVTNDDIGKSRAEVTSAWIKELNPDVQSGRFVDRVWLHCVETFTDLLSGPCRHDQQRY